ncbi:uncharacterized protein I303_100597 [Kwoniella dejecticola CBS 10117]|uniref:N-acetyltransferase domain-containing protein n=1 Tax=Kwoniella dejecticola CBS 10117 TaxID=1296121 RepID=A0A1A6AFI0_9TREE|nr:uncharacterized protein I303_00600 [Kwoniella dejecticola CBS 10117]OBR88783.1 hypothetical protein I303_00600 [Kwoniella dejecticola CBS 10117]
MTSETQSTQLDQNHSESFQANGQVDHDGDVLLNGEGENNRNRMDMNGSADQTVLNLYRPTGTPSTYHAATPRELYDINFVFPFHVLHTDHVRLEPLVPSVHLSGFLRLPPESWIHFGDLGPYTRKTALEDIESYRADPTCLLLAVIDLQLEARGDDGFAGVYGLIEVNQEYMTAVFGLINILPKYQRTHINTHAMALILSYLFEEVHLIRIQYDAVTYNAPSIRAAERFGFKKEGVFRNFNGIVPSHKKIKDHTMGAGKKEQKSKSQDMWVGSLTDYDWFYDGTKTKFATMLERPVVNTTMLNGTTPKSEGRLDE